MKLFIWILSCVSNLLFSLIFFSHLNNAWYPSRSKSLYQKLEFLEQESRKRFSYQIDAPAVTAIIVPHDEGYDYSGVVASAVYQSIRKNNFKRMIILAPSHHIDFQGIAISEGSYEDFHNSLGSVLLDSHLLKKICKNLSFLCTKHQKIFDIEHAIEEQIPFIQKYYKNVSIVPIVVGNVNQSQIVTIANEIQQYLDEQTLLIVTTDLTRYGKAFGYVPFHTDIGVHITKLDERIVNSFERKNLSEFKQIIDETKATVCGLYPLQILLEILQLQKIKNDAYVISYDRSNRDKNPEHSVSYLGMIFGKQKKYELPLSDQLTGYEKNILKDLSLQTLKNLFNRSKINYQNSEIITQTLQQSWGAFVTLYTKDHQLRGCIGRVISDKPLYQTVCDMTREAALEDHRFKPVKLDEIPDLSISISVLNQPKHVASYDKIRLGVDGIILKYKNRSALFLPRVATEQGWDLVKTLQELSRKAGLDLNDWKNKDAQFETFQTIDI